MTGYESKRAAAQDKLEQEPQSFEQWNAKQHGDPEEIGFLQALRIAYIAGQDSITTPPQRKPCPTCEALARSVMMDQTGRDA